MAEQFKEVELDELRLKQHCDSCTQLLTECTCSLAENECSGKATAAPHQPPPGGCITGKYKLDELIGEGGTSRVFKSKHQELGKTFAVKVLRSEVTNNDRAVKRFNQEVSASSQLTHPSLCQIFEHGVTDDGAPYLVMEHLEGEDLRQTIDRDGPLDPQRVIDLFVELSDAVAHAHYKGVIHRDLKPSNIILMEKNGVEGLKIVDFGVAKLLPDPSSDQNLVTQTGEVFGSPLYMSPEQCTGKSIDARSDIYSLGCCMYECLTGKPPHQGDNPVQTILKQISDPPQPFEKSLAVPSGLQKIVMTALQKDPDKRYQSAQDMYRDLLLVRENKPPRGLKCAKKVTLVDRVKKGKKAAMAGLLALAFVSIPVSLLLNDSSFRNRLDSAWFCAHRSMTIEPWNDTIIEAKMLASFWHYDRADPLFQQALEQAKSAKNPLLARYNVLNVYGDFLIDAAQKGKGTWLQARQVFAETAVLGISFGPHAPAHSFERMGMIDYHLKDYVKAEENFARALEYYNKAYPNVLESAASSQVDVGTCLVEQGDNFMQESKISDARAAYLRASEIMTAPEDKVYVLTALQGVAKTFAKDGNYDQADKVYSRAQKLLSKVPHAFAQPALASILNERIQVLQKLGDHLRAAEVKKQLQAISGSTISIQ